jgi:uncharacterized protein HemX
MRAIFVVIVLLIVGIVGLGFYRGWFQMSSNRDNTEQQINTTFTVDEEKIQEDKDKLHELVDQAKDKPSETSEETE